MPTVICSPPFGELIVKIGAAVVAVVVAVLLAVVVVVVARTAVVAGTADAPVEACVGDAKIAGVVGVA